MRRELDEEKIRDFLPPKPDIPHGWELTHTPNSNRFDLNKSVEIRNGCTEHMHIIALMEIKQPETTYRMDTGERDEEQHLTFSLFVKKLRQPGGGLEFMLTAIDSELVLDNITIHADNEQFELAKRVDQRSIAQRNRMYRGPMLTELDEDLFDCFMDYLDERGVNNAFAEYIMSQAQYLEQAEYEAMLENLMVFSR
jgi:hypothetical protein